MTEHPGPPYSPSRAPLWKRRRTWLFAGGGLLAVFVLLVIIGLIIGPQPSKTPAAAVNPTTATVAPVTTTTTVAPPATTMTPSMDTTTTTTTSPSTTTPPPTTTSSAAAPLTSSPAVSPPVIDAGEPNRALTPGHAFATATTAQICVSGYSASVRNVTEDTRKAVFTSYAIAYPPPSGAYELDHLIPLELGGDNTAANLWPQVYHGAGSADVKDHLENHLHDLVCAGQLDLPTAQQAIAGDWMAAAAQYNPVGATARVSTPPPAPVNPAGPPPARPTAAPGAYYANCAAARAAGVAPLHRGDPGYSSKLDGDGDGIACEK